MWLVVVKKKFKESYTVPCKVFLRSCWIICGVILRDTVIFEEAEIDC